MKTNDKSCMGGKCFERELCARHVRPTGSPEERLCSPGAAEHFEPAPGVVPIWPAKSINTDPLNAVYLASK